MNMHITCKDKSLDPITNIVRLNYQNNLELSLPTTFRSMKKLVTGWVLSWHSYIPSSDFRVWCILKFHSVEFN